MTPPVNIRTKVKTGGLWKDINTFSVYNANLNLWQEDVNFVYWKDSSQWKLIYDRGPYDLSTLTSVIILGQGLQYDSVFAYANFEIDGTFNSNVTNGETIQFAFAERELTLPSGTPKLQIKFVPDTLPDYPYELVGSPTDSWLSLETRQFWGLQGPSFISGVWFASGRVYLKRDDLLLSESDMRLSVQTGFGEFLPP